MRAIYKYPLPMMNSLTLSLPKGAEVVHVDIQNGEPQLWALVDPEAPSSDRYFRIFATGQKIPDDAGKHIATFLTDSPADNPLGLVLHLFEGTASQPSAAA